MSFFVFILVGQLIVVAFVFFVLKVVLNKMLIELAVRHIEFWKISEAKEVDRILILSHKSLKKVYIDRVKRAAAKIFAQNVCVDFQIQKSLLGGVVIYAGDKTIDCSLKDRLTRAFRMR